MQTSIFSLLFTLFFCIPQFYGTGACVSAQQTDFNPLTTLHAPVELKADLAILKHQLESVHAGLYTFSTEEEMNAWFANFEAQLTDSMTSQAFYRSLLPLNRLIRNGHTHLVPAPAFDKMWREELPLLPVDVYWYEHELYVLRNNSLNGQLEEGSRILSINGEDAAKVFLELADKFPRDGYNTTFPEAITYRAFNEVYVSFKSIPDTYELKCLSPGGEEFTITLPGLKNTEIESNRTQKYGPQPPAYWEKGYGEPLTLEIKDKVAIMTIKTCGNAELRRFGRSVGKLVDQKFAEIKAAGVTDLIIDIRSNGGGNDMISIALLRHLSNRPYRMLNDSYTIINGVKDREYYTSNTFFMNMLGKIGLKEGEDGRYRNRKITNWVYNQKEEMERTTVDQPFQGQIYCIGDGYSFSAAGMMASWLKTYTNCEFVGEEFGGSESTLTAGEYLNLQLPNTQVQAILPIVFEDVWNPRGRTGHGVQPDHPIRNTVNDLISGYDAIMAHALQLTKASKTNPSEAVVADH